MGNYHLVYFYVENASSRGVHDIILRNLRISKAFFHRVYDAFEGSRSKLFDATDAIRPPDLITKLVEDLRNQRLSQCARYGWLKSVLNEYLCAVKVCK